MRLIKANESTAARRYVFFHLVDATDGITAETGEAGGQPQVSSNGGAWTNTGISTLTAINNGRYYAELTQTLVQNAGTSIETRYKSANTAECPGDSVQVVAFDPHDATSLGLSRIDAAISSRQATVTFPANFASLAITAGGAVTAGTVSDKTGYSLSQSFPSNFASLAITAGGAVTAGTVSDKTGYSLATAPPTSADIADAVWDETTSGHTTAGTYGGRILRSQDSNVEVKVTGGGSGHVAADVHAFQLGVIDSDALANSAGDDIADRILGRNIAGGSSSGRIVKDALRFLRNRFAVSSGTLTVYAEDDTTTAWTATVTGDAAATPIVESNPA